MVRYIIINDNNDWKKITLTNIKIRKGKVEIGFDAAGDAGALWLVDDVEFIRE